MARNDLAEALEFYDKYLNSSAEERRAAGDDAIKWVIEAARKSSVDLNKLENCLIGGTGSLWSDDTNYFCERVLISWDEDWDHPFKNKS